jgi:Cu(I)/Ag(I) efflux system membrane protein CusA/SilA
LLAYNIPLSTVIDQVRQSTNEVGGLVLEMGGARYMTRGHGYLQSVADLQTVAVATKNGTPVLIRDRGNVTLGPDIREGVAEWRSSSWLKPGRDLVRQDRTRRNRSRNLHIRLERCFYSSTALAREHPSLFPA